MCFPFFLFSLSITAVHNVIWFGISMVTYLVCVLSQLFAHPQPTHCAGQRGKKENLDALHSFLSSNKLLCYLYYFSQKLKVQHHTDTQVAQNKILSPKKRGICVNNLRNWELEITVYSAVSNRLMVDYINVFFRYS